MISTAHWQLPIAPAFRFEVCRLDISLPCCLATQSIEVQVLLIGAPLSSAQLRLSDCQCRGASLWQLGVAARCPPVTPGSESEIVPASCAVRGLVRALARHVHCMFGGCSTRKYFGVPARGGPSLYCVSCCASRRRSTTAQYLRGLPAAPCGHGRCHRSRQERRANSLPSPGRSCRLPESWLGDRWDCRAHRRSNARPLYPQARSARRCGLCQASLRS